MLVSQFQSLPVFAKRLFAALVALLIVAGAGMISALESSNSLELELDSPENAANQDTVSAQSGANVFVHVSGEVVSPGIYQLPGNSRLFDAVFAAGGFTEAAAADSVNLARIITDGEQIRVAKLGDPASPVNVESSAVSLSSATVTQLDQLPGIGPTLAQRIVDWRELNGGFSRISDLRKVSGIGQKLYDSLKNLVVP